ncbi:MULTISPECIES: DUF4270 family protein [unclassified Carboxylicivirga]|uniref:DUF4270 family protein n=1 Tax=Carboxylicivirga TaxID=1628153 RepID=UPI003D357B7C
MKKFSLKKISFRAGQLFVIGLLSFTVACQDDPARLSGDVLPEGEMIKGHVHDEHVLTTQNTARESVRTSDASFGILGSLLDPEFGRSNAAFAVDFSIGNEVKFNVDILELSESNDTIIYENHIFEKFNNNIDTVSDVWRVDSLVFNLNYQFNNWYGNMTHKQQVNIYELNTSLGNSTQEYYSDHDVTGMYNQVPVGSRSVHPNDEVPDTLRSLNWMSLYEHPDSLWNHPQYLWDNVKVQEAIDTAWLAEDFKGNTRTMKSWGFKLSDELANEFFNLSESQLKSSAAFKDFFKGVYVALDESSLSNGGGWLLKTHLLSGSQSIATNLTIHLSRDHKYLGKDTVIRDTTSLYAYQFPINLENVRFNTYEHELSSNIDVEDETPERVYIQGMAGSYMKMQLPDEMIYWVDSIGNPEREQKEHYNLVSNIEFFLEIDTIASDLDRYPAPEKLTIKWMNDEGELEEPLYTALVNGNTISSPIFGTNANSSGQRSGVGERVVRYSSEGNPEFLYRFIMRADYFNYVMRDLYDKKIRGQYELTDPEFIKIFNDAFKSSFLVGPENTTSTFRRVVLHGAAHEERPLKMNIKYYQYRPR